MSKWKCDICNSTFDNYDARGFDNKIYCPLCYYKKLYKDTELERERLNKINNELISTGAELENKLYEEQDKNERLNNIINELEKTLLEWHEYWEDDDSYSWQYKNAYDYLQELKGSDKE